MCYAHRTQQHSCFYDFIKMNFLYFYIMVIIIIIIIIVLFPDKSASSHVSSGYSELPGNLSINSHLLQGNSSTDVMATAAEDVTLTRFSVGIFKYPLLQRTRTCARLQDGALDGPGFSRAADATHLNVSAPGRASHHGNTTAQGRGGRKM